MRGSLGGFGELGGFWGSVGARRSRLEETRIRYDQHVGKQGRSVNDSNLVSQKIQSYRLPRHGKKKKHCNCI